MLAGMPFTVPAALPVAPLAAGEVGVVPIGRVEADISDPREWWGARAL